MWAVWARFGGQVTGDLLDMIRGPHCQRDPDGAWRCACGALLAECDGITCADCAAKATELDRQQARARARSERETRTRQTGERAYAAVPDWPHLHDGDAYARVVTHPGLRAIGERYTPGHGSILLLGPSGAGKTSAIARAMHRIRAERIDRVLDERSAEAADRLREIERYVWVTAWDIARAHGAHRYGTGDEPDLVARAARARLLVIDEMGPEPVHRVGELMDLVDRRYARGLPTVATSGLALAIWRERYGDALFRRLTETGRGSLVDAHRVTGGP